MPRRPGARRSAGVVAEHDDHDEENRRADQRLRAIGDGGQNRARVAERPVKARQNFGREDRERSVVPIVLAQLVGIRDGARLHHDGRNAGRVRPVERGGVDGATQIDAAAGFLGLLIVVRCQHRDADAAARGLLAMGGLVRPWSLLPGSWPCASQTASIGTRMALSQAVPVGFMRPTTS